MRALSEWNRRVCSDIEELRRGKREQRGIDLLVWHARRLFRHWTRDAYSWGKDEERRDIPG